MFSDVKLALWSGEIYIEIFDVSISVFSQQLSVKKKKESIMQ